MVEALVTVAGLASVTIITIMWLRRPKLGATRRSEIEDDRLRRLEQAIESIAIEVERISESQRFSAKLLAEREVEAPKKLGS